MKKPVKTEEPRAVPRLSGETKAMNGKSTRKLLRCIDDLHCILDAEDTPVKPQEDDAKATDE